MIGTVDYDVIIAGGSVSGLLCAREIAGSGYRVLVLEEDHEIGTPEHCGGVVSLSGIEELGVLPSKRTLENKIKFATIFSPSGKSFRLDATKQKVVVLDRRGFDKIIAHQAKKKGSEIRVKSSVKKIDYNGVTTSDGQMTCKVIVDARGVSSLINNDRQGVLQSAQYEIYADWINKDGIEVYFDQENYPGFFAWIIPTLNDISRIGVAGKGINAANKLEKFLSKQGSYSVIRKIFAPIWVRGPIERFVQKNIVTIGDAAGQSKPTTAGGIYSCGLGGILAGKKITKFLSSSNPNDLLDYQKNWGEKFGNEFKNMLLARKLFERLDNKTLDNLFESITPEILNEISKDGIFDFHSISLAKILGLKGSIGAIQAIMGNEFRRMFT